MSLDRIVVPMTRPPDLGYQIGLGTTRWRGRRLDKAIEFRVVAAADVAKSVGWERPTYCLSISADRGYAEAWSGLHVLA